MKLLIVTQTVNTNDPVLGFFHHWIEELAPLCDRVEVICLSKGAYSLPVHVGVHSLGKEQGTRSRLLYALRFYWLIFKLRNSYDAVFVHMNPEYVWLGGKFWKARHKKIALWYNHDKGNPYLEKAATLCDRIFYTSPFAITSSFKQSRRMPAGIDTNLFKPEPVSRDRNSVYFQGRVAPAKHVRELVEALGELTNTNPKVRADIVGPEDVAYSEEIKKSHPSLIPSVVSFLGPKRNEETPALYSAHGVAVNLTAAGNYDKTVLEAMACETPVVVASSAFADLVPSEWIVGDLKPTTLGETIGKLMQLDAMSYGALGSELRRKVVEQHSLQSLCQAIISAFVSIEG